MFKIYIYKQNLGKEYIFSQPWCDSSSVTTEQTLMEPFPYGPILPNRMRSHFVVGFMMGHWPNITRVPAKPLPQTMG